MTQETILSCAGVKMHLAVGVTDELQYTTEEKLEERNQ